MVRSGRGGHEECFASARGCDGSAADDIGCEDDVVAETVMCSLEATRPNKDGFMSFIIGGNGLCISGVDLSKDKLAKR